MTAARHPVVRAAVPIAATAPVSDVDATRVLFFQSEPHITAISAVHTLLLRHFDPRTVDAMSRVYRPHRGGRLSRLL